MGDAALNGGNGGVSDAAGTIGHVREERANPGVQGRLHAKALVAPHVRHIRLHSATPQGRRPNGCAIWLCIPAKISRGLC